MLREISDILNYDSYLFLIFTTYRFIHCFQFVNFLFSHECTAHSGNRYGSYCHGNHTFSQWNMLLRTACGKAVCSFFGYLFTKYTCVKDKANHCRIKGMHTLHTAYYFTFNLILLSMKQSILLCIVLSTAFTNSNIGIVIAIITFESLLGMCLHRVMMATWTCNPRSLIWLHVYKHSLC